VSANSDSVVVENLSKVFPARGRAGRAHGSIVAVDDVSFRVAEGRSLGIVGASGSGKTTIARMIVGLERPTGGRIVVEGRVRQPGRARSAERRRRGREAQIVFQDPYSSLDPRQRVADCLAEVIKLHFGPSRGERLAQVTALLAQVGLDERHGRALPHNLSGGQRQRVAIARALAAQPRVLILDESVAALDVSIQAQVLNLLADIREATSVSMLFVSHDLGVVRQVTDDIIVMWQGRVVERGGTGQVLDSPVSSYTKALLAAVPRPGWKPRRAVAALGQLSPRAAQSPRDEPRTDKPPGDEPTVHQKDDPVD
jgi:peptide/nickel transport system ATP-binding protein